MLKNEDLGVEKQTVAPTETDPYEAACELIRANIRDQFRGFTRADFENEYWGDWPERLEILDEFDAMLKLLADGNTIALLDSHSDAAHQYAHMLMLEDQGVDIEWAGRGGKDPGDDRILNWHLLQDSFDIFRGNGSFRFGVAPSTNFMSSSFEHSNVLALNAGLKSILDPAQALLEQAGENRDAVRRNATREPIPESSGDPIIDILRYSNELRKRDPWAAAFPRLP